MTKAKRTKPKAAAPSQTAAEPRQQRPQQTVEPPQPRALAMVPERLVTTQRSQSTQIIEALTKTAVALSGKEGGIAQVEIMERLWGMQKEAEDRQAEREFGIAKVALAMELPVIPKNHSITFVDKNNVTRDTPYADRVDIESVLDPICKRHGFSKEYSSETIEGRACQVLTVRHVSGHKVVYRSPYMPVDSTGSKNNNQAAGSTAEYGKRYALVGAFNIIGVDKDDDGNLGAEPGAPKDDKFAARVQEQSAQAQAKPTDGKSPPAKLTLPEAAGALEERIRAAAPADRGAILMKHIAIVGEMEKDVVLSLKADELRKLCAETANAAA